MNLNPAQAPLPQIEWNGREHHDVRGKRRMEGLRRPRVVSPGNARERQGTIPHPVSFSVCSSSGVGFQTATVGEWQLSKQVWKVDTRSVRQVSAESPQFQELAVAWPLEVPAQARPIL